jgi:UTP--glucose-1-phosphate uridylyltransferase
LIEIDCILEKPTPTQAEQQLQVPGVRAGSYLCFFGMHVLPPSFIPLLRERLAVGASVEFSDVLQELVRRERYLAMEMRGTRHDLGIRYGAWIAQLALGLAGVDREDVLSHLVDALANQPPVARGEGGAGGISGE